MSQVVPFNSLKDFLVNGKGREQGTFLPADADIDAVVNAFETGLSSKHMATSAIRLLPFDGVDGSGVDPDLTCTFTGALEGDVVAGVIDTSDFSDARAKFETTISAAGHIEQTSLTDLSTTTFLALLVKA